MVLARRNITYLITVTPLVIILVLTYGYEQSGRVEVILKFNILLYLTGHTVINCSLSLKTVLMFRTSVHPIVDDFGSMSGCDKPHALFIEATVAWNNSCFAPVHITVGKYFNVLLVCIHVVGHTMCSYLFVTENVHLQRRVVICKIHFERRLLIRASALAYQI